MDLAQPKHYRPNRGCRRSQKKSLLSRKVGCQSQRQRADMELEGDGKRERTDSPSNSQQTFSEDDEIEIDRNSMKPESYLYDPDIDDQDELWVQKERMGRESDAVLSCPACFTTLCLECQRHERYVHQYRAVFVVNCKIGNGQVKQIRQKPKRGKRGRECSEVEACVAVGETFKPVCCSICSTNVGVIDEDEVYHFFNVLPSEA